jgi:hypothetical protein
MTVGAHFCGAGLFMLKWVEQIAQLGQSAEALEAGADAEHGTPQLVAPSAGQAGAGPSSADVAEPSAAAPSAHASGAPALPSFDTVSGLVDGFGGKRSAMVLAGQTEIDAFRREVQTQVWHSLAVSLV